MILIPGRLKKCNYEEMKTHGITSHLAGACFNLLGRKVEAGKGEGALRRKTAKGIYFYGNEKSGGRRKIMFAE
ncbi:MAG: hypothetical protein JW913_19230 [Chitinispirillaceae bacterium]|nr:hypothetical protein [Chitinispirillaceae bacterium]